MAVTNIVSSRRVRQHDWQSKGIPFYRAREIGKLSDYDKVENELFISEELYSILSQSGVPTEGDIMITAVGTLGKAYIVKASDKFYYKDASVICFQNLGVNPQYLKLVIDSDFFHQQIAKDSMGTTVGTLTIIRANQYLVPLPPTKEQRRIVEKVENVLKAIK